MFTDNSTFVRTQLFLKILEVTESKERVIKNIFRKLNTARETLTDNPKEESREPRTSESIVAGETSAYLIIMTHNERDMKSRWKRIIHYGKQVRPNLNSEKTKILKVCTTKDCVLSIDGHQILEVKTFQYLGSIITKDGGPNADVKFRIMKVRQFF